jgi:hypothetical protein
MPGGIRGPGGEGGRCGRKTKTPPEVFLAQLTEQVSKVESPAVAAESRNVAIAEGLRVYLKNRALHCLMAALQRLQGVGAGLGVRVEDVGWFR